MSDRVLRTSAWMDDASLVQVEVVWARDDGTRAGVRFSLDAQQAEDFAERLRLASVSPNKPVMP